MTIHSSFDFEKARIVVCVAVNEINYDNLVHAYAVHHEPVTWNPNPQLNFALRKLLEAPNAGLSKSKIESYLLPQAAWNGSLSWP